MFNVSMDEWFLNTIRGMLLKWSRKTNVNPDFQDDDRDVWKDLLRLERENEFVGCVQTDANARIDPDEERLGAFRVDQCEVDKRRETVEAATT